MENALYYTFSTIPQVIAGAIALLSAFVLYRLQFINHQIEEKSLTIQQLCTDIQNNGLWEYHVNEQYEEVLINAANYQPESQNNKRLFKLHNSKLKKLIQEKKSILKYFKISLSITISLTIASIIVLPSTPYIIKRCSSNIIFSIGIIWFTLCLISYIVLVKKTIGH